MKNYLSKRNKSSLYFSVTKKQHLLPKIKLITQADAVIYFLQRIDIEMISDILDNNRTYQHFEKAIFIHKLGIAFDEFINEGDTFLNCHEGFCNNELCNYKCSGFTFIGNNSNNYMDLIFEIKEGIVHDIYECKNLKTIDVVNEKKRRIQINKLDVLLFPPF